MINNNIITIYRGTTSSTNTRLHDTVDYFNALADSLCLLYC